MINRDPRHQQRRRGGAWLSDADSGCTHGVPLFEPKPGPRTQPSYAGGTSGMGGVNRAFWNTFAYNKVLQPPLHPTPHPAPQPPVEPTSQRTPEPHATSQQSGGRIVPWSEHEMVVAEKILIESEGDTYLLYYPFTKFEMLLVCNSMLLKYYYWLPQHGRQVHRNFEVNRAKQLKNLFAYACKSSKVSSDSWALLQKYWKDPDFQKLSTQNKKNCSSDPEGMDPSLHTCRAIPITEQRGRLEHRNRWQEYRSSQPSTNGSSQSPPLSYRGIWAQGNLTSKGCVYGFGAEGVVMKQRSHLSVSSRSSSVNNYDARKMATRLNESAVKATEEAHKKEMQDVRKQVEEEMRAKEAKFENELAQEKATRFFKSQQAGSSTALPNTTPSGDDDEDEPDTSDLGDSSHD
ncbi:LOW QUALITY PROTEIN: hypothetical protein Cgig2_010117 [Carnegiea gigantea]|uniref:Uncharacterized protein n=1 Tax=Carnegiea gigantea TaxID=171969 RepID=A0A9Q1JQR2_9CARY|nr:LOW QUALITY PROTEIN: hypothetical protein Cgig2_010117 [Carnegiea gigantea]